jgi:hypothetical protein
LLESGGTAAAGAVLVARGDMPKRSFTAASHPAFPLLADALEENLWWVLLGPFDDIGADKDCRKADDWKETNIRVNCKCLEGGCTCGVYDVKLKSSRVFELEVCS